jgi:uncharacterized protein
VLPYGRALVTGASSGIGEAFARRLAAEGADLVVVARRRERLEQLAAELESRTPTKVEVIAADLTDPDGLAAVEHRLSVGDIDLLVNNAGFGTTVEFAEADPGRMQSEMALDVVAVVRLTHAALQPMKAAGHGAVINVSSIVGFLPIPYMAVYSGAKAFVTAFSESLAEELRGTNVTLQVLCPGLTRTEFQDVAHVGRTNLLPSFAWQTPEDVVAQSLGALESPRVVVVPGLHNRLAALALQLLPSWPVRRITGIVQRL